MRRLLCTCVVGVSLLRIGGVTASAQAPGQNGPAAADAALRVQVTISRTQGNKVVSRIPFTFLVNAAPAGLPTRMPEPARLRLGVEVPVLSAPVASDAKPDVPRPQVPVFQYRPVGTNIDCNAIALPSGLFKITLSVEESAPYSDQDKPTIGTLGDDASRARIGAPVFRSYRASNVLVLRDGQTEQFWTAVDRFTGESITMDVTLSVVK